MTGSVIGKYYNIGKLIKNFLELRGIQARVLQTDGSLENLMELKNRNAISLVQYDMALASILDDPIKIYKTEISDTIPVVKSMKRIATLHKEILHLNIWDYLEPLPK